MRDWRQQVASAPRGTGAGESRGGATRPESGRPRAAALWDSVTSLEASGASERGRNRARRLAEAGDLLARAGLPGAAAVRYGVAIDCYLEAGYFSFAQRLCMRLLEAAPRVVRARATLILIMIGRGSRTEAEALLREYADASREAGDVAFALRRLCLIAQVVADPALRDAILGHLDRLRENARIEPNPCLRCGALCQRAETRSAAPGVYWERLVNIGVRGPRELAAATPNWDAAARLSPGSLAAWAALGPASHA